MSQSSQKNERQHLAERNLARWLFWVVWDWAIVVGCFMAIDALQHWWIWPLAIFIIGNRQHALAILGHDGTHWLACKNRALNDTLTNVFCFLPFGANLNSYRVVHLQHHTKLGTDGDPELDFKKEMEPEWNLPTSRPALVRRFFKDLAAFGWRDILIIMKSMPVRRKRDIVYVCAFWLSALTLLFFVGKLWFIAVWFVALAIPNWAIFRLRIWSEHVGTNGTHRLEATWWQKWLFMPHNTWLHYEHHHWPWVPFYKLPAARLSIEGSSTQSFSELVDQLSSQHEPKP